MVTAARMKQARCTTACRECKISDLGESCQKIHLTWSTSSSGPHVGRNRFDHAARVTVQIGGTCMKFTTYIVSYSLGYSPPRPRPGAFYVTRGSPPPHLSSILGPTTARMTVDPDWACALYHRCQTPCKTRRLTLMTTRLFCRRRTILVWAARATATAERVHRNVQDPVPGGTITL